MVTDFPRAFSALKSILDKYSDRLTVKTDDPGEYTLVTKTASPFPQHKGQPLFFGSVRIGKAYVSFHLLPLYMQPTLTKRISPTLKKRMQGKACFNFKDEPDSELLSELAKLTEAGLASWCERHWV
jgi:hypothetical protein